MGVIRSERETREGPFTPQSGLIHTSSTESAAPQKGHVHFSGGAVGPIISRDGSLINRCCFAPG